MKIIVDAMGGVPMDVPQDMDYEDLNEMVDKDAVEAFRAVDGVQAVMPKADFGSMLGNYSVALKAGTGDRYVCDWANVLGIDTSALEDMGYEILDGDFPSGDSVAVGQ